MKRLMIAAVLTGALTCAADSSYTYSAGDTGSGAVTITYDGDTTNIKTLTANTAGDTVTISGDPMTFADGATITLASSGTVSFAQKVTTLGATTLARGDDAYTVWTGNPLTESTVATSVFGGLGRDAYVDSSIVVVGDDGPCPGRFTYVAGPGSGIYTLNMVRPDYTYSIRPQLSQDTSGKITAVRCVTGSRSPQFAEYPTTDLWGNKSCEHYCTDTAASNSKVTKIGSTSALKLKKIIIRKKGMAETVWVRFDGGVALGGTTSVGAGVEAVIGASEGDGVATLDYPITGDGDVRIATPASTAAFSGTAYFEPFINTSWQVLAMNRSLSALTGLSAHMLGGSHNYSQYADVGGTPTDAYYIKYNPATDTATCQFQYWTGSGLKFVKAQLRQKEMNVEIKGVGAGYYTNAEYNYNNNDPHDFDNNNNNQTLATSATATGYGIHYITATFTGAARGIAKLNSTMNTMFGGRLTFDGVNAPLYVTVTNKSAFPVCGVVNVGTNADVMLKATGLVLSEGVSGGSSKVCVQRGGILRRSAVNGQIGVFQDLVIDGGTYSSESYNNYQNYTTLMNGGRITGDVMPRTVYIYTPHYWRVRGTSPSFIDSGINVFGAAAASDGKSKRFMFDVADVTGNDAVDCTVAKITNTDSPAYRFPYFRFEKLGAGTMLLAGSGKDMRLETFVSGGTFLLGASGIVTNEFVLCGGNLAAVAGAQNNLGALTVSNACTITVGAGGSISFASFAPGSGLPTSSVKIDAPISGNFVKFRTELTAAQRSYFRWKDDTDATKLWKVQQDANGYLHPMMGFRIVIR